MPSRRILSDIALEAIDEVEFEALEKASASVQAIRSFENIITRADEKAVDGSPPELPFSTAVNAIV